MPPNPNDALHQVFADEDYGFRMRFEQAAAAEFFGDTPEHAEIIKDREKCLTSAPELCVSAIHCLAPLLDEAIEFAASVANVPEPEPRGSDEHALLSLGRAWEPDFLLLKKSDDETIRLLGGCVCFPSSWSVAEKIGKPIDVIHEPVPGLNPAIGSPIEKFLTRLRPGTAWLRSNWGFSRSAELNQHPARRLPRLDGAVVASEVWLRVENQALVALPRSGGILFGIRIKNYSLAGMTEDGSLCRLIARALRTMPENSAAYKGLAAARDRLIQLLTGQSGAQPA